MAIDPNVQAAFDQLDNARSALVAAYGDKKNADAALATAQGQQTSAVTELEAAKARLDNAKSQFDSALNAYLTVDPSVAQPPAQATDKPATAVKK